MVKGSRQIEIGNSILIFFLLMQRLIVIIKTYYRYFILQFFLDSFNKIGFTGPAKACNSHNPLFH
ncbi:MAG: DUF1563 domain-containing protein [Bacteroidetes bacterium]|nr:DUF1563 domain-containing protein [Bacteroidota bacterium]